MRFAAVAKPESIFVAATKLLRHRIEQNRIIDSGSDKGVAIDINGETEGVILAKNEWRETRKPLSRIRILIGAETREIRCVDHVIQGCEIRFRI